MIGHWLVWIVLLCAPQVYGHDTVEERLLELERVVKFQNEAISQQREELVLLKSENNLLKDHVQNLEQQINELIEKPDEIIEDTKTLSVEEMESLPKESLPNIGTAEANVLTDSEALRKRRSIDSRSASDVAFYAYLTGSPCLHDHETLVFNHEVTDLTGSYNPTDGIYIVPITGTYVFTWTTAARNDWYASELMVNGDSIAHTFPEGGATTVGQVTGIAVINVNQGDHVFIKKVEGNGCNIHGTNYHLTSFAGWRLFG